MNKEELLNYQLTRDDFVILPSGVLIKYNSNIIKKILSDQEDAQELRAIKETGIIFGDREWVKDQIKQLREKAEKFDEFVGNVDFQKILDENKELKELGANSNESF